MWNCTSPLDDPNVSDASHLARGTQHRRTNARKPIANGMEWTILGAETRKKNIEYDFVGDHRRNMRCASRPLPLRQKDGGGKRTDDGRANKPEDTDAERGRGGDE